MRAGREVWRKMTLEIAELVRAYLTSEEHAFTSVKHLPEQLQWQISEKTIRRGLKKFTNLGFHRAACKAELVAGDEGRRLEYALNHVNWPAERWTRTVAMDEKVFSSSKDGKIILFFRIT